MEQHPPSQDSHNESYFASFADMLVGIIFIFIILLMIVANNYQEATEAVVQSNQALAEARNKARDEARDRARDEARDKVRDAAHNREMAETKALKTARTFQEARVSEITKGIQDTQAIEDAKAASAARANEDALMMRLTDTQQNLINDSRAKVLRKIQEAMNMQGFDVNIDTNQGILLIPENILFNPSLNQGEVNDKGKQTVSTLASLFSKYLPCISPTADVSRLYACNGLDFSPNNGLDVIFIDYYPDTHASREDKLLLSVQRTVSLFNELKNDEPYLDEELRNIAGVPILDIKVNQERRNVWNWEQDNPAFRKFVVLRFIMRRPNQTDIIKLKDANTNLTQ